MINKHIVLLVFLILIWACQEESTIIESIPAPLIEQVTMAARWNITSHSKKRIEVKVNDADIVTVLVTIREAIAGNILLQDSLYDDAGYYHPDDGDVVAGDSYFSNRFLASEIIPAVEEKMNCVFEFKAVSADGRESVSRQMEVEFLRDALPEIISFSAPDSVPSGIPEVVFQVVAVDSDGLDKIKTVYYEGRMPGSRVALFRDTLTFVETTMHNDREAALYRSVRDSTLGAGKVGYYALHFFVMDDLDEINEEAMVSMIYIENKVGVVWGTRVPGEVERPMKFPVEAMVSDPQGLLDVESVYFQTVKPDGSFGSNGALFDMRDTGEAFYGDQAAGDGTYSKYIQVEEQNDPGRYYFHFYMRDRAGHISEMKLDSISVK
jgi:hypothetical protein